MPPRRNLCRAIYSLSFLLEKLTQKRTRDLLKMQGCKAYQFLKRNKKQYGKLPPKEIESKPWEVLCVDLIGQYQFKPKGKDKKYQMTTKNGNTIYLQAVTMIDSATG